MSTTHLLSLTCGAPYWVCSRLVLLWALHPPWADQEAKPSPSYMALYQATNSAFICYYLTRKFYFGGGGILKHIPLDYLYKLHTTQTFCPPNHVLSLALVWFQIKSKVVVVVVVVVVRYAWSTGVISVPKYCLSKYFESHRSNSKTIF